MPLGSLMLILLPVCFLLSGGSRAASLSGLKDIVPDAVMLGGVSNISTFLLDRASGVLFLGARDTILAVDVKNLNQQSKKIVWDVPEEKRKSCVSKGKTEADCRNYIRLLEFLGDGRVYVCGTYAFEPQCAFLDISSFTLEKDEDGGVKMETGKSKCPFEPSQQYTALVADGLLYSAVTNNFLGTQFDITRATGPENERIRTQQSINWLSDPEFVSSALIEESPDNNPTGEDGQIYFFFTEIAKEYDMYTKVKVPRVARVCKSDMGGMKTLQRRWTTFLKAQLVCEDKPSGQRYNILKDVFTLQHTQGVPNSTHFYGLFTSQWEPEDVSAVCVFSLSDIVKVMDGPFKELKKTCENWLNPEPVPSPRPGQCLNSALKAEGFQSSLNLPDKVLTYVRDHPLMENSVKAAPQLVRMGVRYTKLAVTLMGGAEKQRGAVLHLGTEHGELHQVAAVGQNASLLQEIPLFPLQEPVNNILLHQDHAVVGSASSVARIKAEGCALYSSCEVCARARGLGCVWDVTHEVCTLSQTDPGPGDVVNKALKKCHGQEGRCQPSITELRVFTGLQLLLPCIQLSPRSCSWEHPRQRHTRQVHSDLVVTVTEESIGNYICTCQEGGPEIRDPTPCRRAAYQLMLEEPHVQSRHMLSIYIFFFCGGLLIGVGLFYFLSRKRGNVCQGHHQPDKPPSCEKDKGHLGSPVTPQSPISDSLLSEAFQRTGKQNGTTASTTATTLLSSQGNGGHHGIMSNATNGHSLYVNSNSSSSWMKFSSDILVADELDRRTEEKKQMRCEGEEREVEDGDEVDDGLGDTLKEGIKGLEEELASLPSPDSSAPLAPGEENSV